MIEKALEDTSGNVTQTAKKAGDLKKKPPNEDERVRTARGFVVTHQQNVVRVSLLRVNTHV